MQPIADLQSHLHNLWTSYSVDEAYQNLFLVYIETFTNRKKFKGKSKKLINKIHCILYFKKTFSYDPKLNTNFSNNCNIK